MYHASRDLSIDVPNPWRAADRSAGASSALRFNCGIQKAMAISEKINHTPIDPFQPWPVQWPMAMLNPEASDAVMFIATL